MDDKSKHDYKNELWMLQFTHRMSNHLCIYCGEVKTENGACDACREKKRQERIKKYGYDPYEGDLDV